MFEKAIEIIMQEPPELHYPAYYADLLRAKGSEIPNSSDLRQQAIDLLDEQIAICDRALTNPGISMNDEFAVKVEKRSLIAYREKLECLLSTSVHPEKHTDKRTETHSCDLIDRQAAIDVVRKSYDEILDFSSDGHTIADSVEDIINTVPPVQPENCEGCKHLGKWENEVEYGYNSPCTGCKRGASDRYEK